MAFFQCGFFSESLGKQVSVWVTLPQKATGNIGVRSKAGCGNHPVLYLLHGLSDDHTIWMRRTSIDRYADESGLAVVMPAVDRSFYCDMVHGYRYWTYVTEELPALMAQFFHISDKREDSFVAGLSMGGYGAFKVGLGRPDRFAAAASLSGALDMAKRFDTGDEAGLMKDLKLVYGDPDKISGTANDLFYLARKVAKMKGPKPALYQWCGTEDFLYAQNLRFRDHAARIGLKVLYEEGPGGHEWKHWDEKIKTVIAWLPIKRTARG